MIPPPGNLDVDNSQLADNWKNWRDGWKHYSIAIGLDDTTESVQVSTFLTCIGPSARRLFNTFQWSSGQDKDVLKDIIDKFDEHCLPQTNVPFERYRFNQRAQQPGEKFDVFLTSLRELALSCEFESQTPDEVLRDKIIFGINDDKVRERLLRCGEIDLRKTIEMCKAAESTHAQMKEVTATSSAEINAVSSTQFRRKKQAGDIQTPSGQVIECNYCGNNHVRNKYKCPAWGKACSNCHGLNHFAVKCRRKNNVKAVEEEHLVFAVGHECDRSRWVTLSLENGNIVRFQLDTGAQCNVLPLHIYKQATGDDSLSEVQPHMSALICYGGTRIPVCGLARIKVQRGDIVCFLDCKLIKADDMRPILGYKACVGMGFVHFKDCDDSFEPLISKIVHVVNGPTPVTREEVIKNHECVFADEVGYVEGKYQIKVDPAVPPVQHCPRRVPVALREKLRSEIERLASLGVIERTEEPTPWVSSIVTVLKKNGSLRICLDPKDLNQAIEREIYQIPTIEEVATRLAGAKCFTTLDVRHGYWHVRLDESSEFLTTFNTPFGRFRWKRMPFGIKSASEVFQKKMHELISGLEGVEVIADDFVIFGCGPTEQQAAVDHDRKLDIFLKRCAERGVRLNRDKFQLRKSEVPFIGHVATKDGLKVHPDKIRAIVDMPVPTDVQGVQRLLGMVQYLSKFIPNLSDLTKPLRELTFPRTEWSWAKEHAKALSKIKNAVTNAPVLRYYNDKDPVTIQCDASQSGLGAVLLQDDQPVAYASRALTSTEVRYAQIEKELLAILWACEKFDAYLYGRSEVTVDSDHKPLEAIFKKSLDQVPMRLQRMRLRLQRYNLSVRYRQGRLMHVADTLSRAYLPHSEDADKDEQAFSVRHDILPSNLQEIIEEYDQDENMLELKKMIQFGWPANKSEVKVGVLPFWNIRDELTLDGGLILKRDQIVIPSSMRRSMLELTHQTHIGIDACLRRARDSIFWPGMNGELKSFIQSCDVCMTFRPSNPHEPILSQEIAEGPWSKVAVDLCDFQGRQLLVVVDYYSNYIEVARVTNISSQAIIYALSDMFARYGSPCVLVSDNGPQFASSEFTQFCREWGTTHRTSSPLHPQSNGKAENGVRTVKRLFQKCKEDRISEFRALLDWRNTPSEGFGTSPAQRFFGRRCRTLLPVCPALLEPQFDVTETQNEIKVQKERQKFYHDRTSKPLCSLNEGQAIRMRLPGQVRWSPGEVVRRLSARSYLVCVRGVRYRRNRKQLLVDRAERRTADLSDQHQPAVDDPTSASLDRCEPGDRSLLNIPVQDVRTPRRAVGTNPTDPGEGEALTTESSKWRSGAMARAMEGRSDAEQESPVIETADTPVRRSNRQCRLPHYLNDYILP